MKKILKYNKNTKIMEVIEQKDFSEADIESAEFIKTYIKETVKESLKNSKEEQKRIEKRNKASFIITILSFLISVMALKISYSQKTINEEQANVNIRRFELEKQPLFECHIEQEEIYNEKKYWELYSIWLEENNIKNFNEWYIRKFQDDSIAYLDVNDYKTFWDAYDNYDNKTLNNLTGNKFATLIDEYKKYLSSHNYRNYLNWKNDYEYKKINIVVKNTGAPITNARLNVYTFVKYQLNIENILSYSFVIDMNCDILNEFWEGTYYNYSSYDSGENAFTIEYTQTPIGVNNDEYIELNNLLNFLSSNEILNEIGLDENNVDGFYEIDNIVYFSINYLDKGQTEQIDWYRYNLLNNTLDYVETYNSDVKLPDITHGGVDDNYYEANTLRIAEILGYQNAQWRPFDTLFDFSYIENAKQKIIFDLKEIIKKNNYDK